MKAFVTEDGRITIPEEIRERYDIRPGMELGFQLSNGVLRLRKVPDYAAQEALLGMFSGGTGGQDGVGAPRRDPWPCRAAYNRSSTRSRRQMILAVDTSVLFTIFDGEPLGRLWITYLRTQNLFNEVVVSPAALAEICAFFHSRDAFLRGLEAFNVSFSPMAEASCMWAGEIFAAYRERGGGRATILTDFLIAPHAAIQTDRFATEDRGYLRSYFPKLHLVQPV